MRSDAPTVTRPKTDGVVSQDGIPILRLRQDMSRRRRRSPGWPASRVRERGAGDGRVARLASRSWPSTRITGRRMPTRFAGTASTRSSHQESGHFLMLEDADQLNWLVADVLNTRIPRLRRAENQGRGSTPFRTRSVTGMLQFGRKTGPSRWPKPSRPTAAGSSREIGY